MLPTIKDQKGVLRTTVCFIALFFYHGMRDYLLTGICAVGTASQGSYPDAETPGTGSLHGVSLAARNSTIIRPDRDGRQTQHIAPKSWGDYTLDEENSWSSARLGLHMTSYLLGSAFVLSLIIWLAHSKLLSSGFKYNHVIGISWLLGGMLAAGAYIGTINSYVFDAWRFLQGIVQGFSLPFVIWLLHFLIVKGHNLPYGAVFFGSWMGTIFGVGLGGIDEPFIGSFIFGVLCLLMAALILLFANKDFTEVDEKAILLFKKTDFKEIFTSSGMWVCFVLQMCSTWALYTFFFGLSLTLYFRHQEENVALKVFLAVALGGLLSRFMNLFLSLTVFEYDRFTKITRCRGLVAVGTVLTGIFLLLCGTIGLESEIALLLCTAAGIALGFGLTSLGVRLNLHYVAPAYPCSILLIAGVFNYMAASLSVFLFPAISKVGEDSTSDDNKWYWALAWSYPIVLLAIATALYLLFISVECLNHQKTPKIELMQNGNLVTAHTDCIEMDAKSFKSVKSGLTFKSIRTSPSKGRTTTFGTVKDGPDDDFGSVDQSENAECWSVAEDSACDAVSIKSSISSYNSVKRQSQGDAGKHFGVILSAKNLDTTSAWISTHHQIDPQVIQDENVGVALSSPHRKLPTTLYMDILW